MPKSKHRQPKPMPRQKLQTVLSPKKTSSLLAIMKDGLEYQSIVDAIPDNIDLVGEIVEGLSEISAVRGRPCLAYLGNVVTPKSGAGVDSSDDLAFSEMVKSVPATERKVDILLSTNGGSGQQIQRFVDSLRNRFDEVDFIIPSFCMSAGTLFALSGDNIWMTQNASLGPIDPQIPIQSGRYVPAQALLMLVEKLQKEGMESMSKGQPIPWTSIRMIDTIDKKELGDAISATQYSEQMAASFIEKYKFKHWTTKDTTKAVVTSADRKTRAKEIAQALASHDKWKSHGHCINRDVLWNEIKLKINHPDDKMERVVNRCWALAHWIFERTPVTKIISCPTYKYVKFDMAGANQ